MPESVNVPYDRHQEAQKWALFAAHALAGFNAFGYYDHGNQTHSEINQGEAVALAADQADDMIAEFKARFHHDPDQPKEKP